MPRDTRIADRLRSFGLVVAETDGWKNRGSETFAPKGSVDHHTAGAKTGNAPSLRVCINGRSDLPGPLCHVLVGRDNTCYVIAAGRANHAGRGGYRGLSGNSMVYGVERENVGTTAEPWRADQTQTAARVHAALISTLATPDPELVCGHREWAPGRKVDSHSVNYPALRASIRELLVGQEDWLMALTDAEQKELLEATRYIRKQLMDKNATSQLVDLPDAHTWEGLQEVRDKVRKGFVEGFPVKP